MTIHPRPAPAASYEWQPALSAQAEYDDNLTLRVDDPIHTSKWTGIATGHFARRTGKDELSFSGRLINSRYSAGGEFDSDDYFVDGSYLRLGTRGRFDLAFSLAEDTNLTSELETTGLVQTRKKRESWRLGPGLQYQWSERWNLSAQASQAGVRFIDAAGTGLEGYDYRTGTIGLNYLWNERNGFGLLLGQNDFESALSGRQTRSRLGTVSWRSLVGQRWTLEGSVGRIHSAIDRVAAPAETESGETYDFSLRHQGPAWEYQLSAARSLSPGGGGELLSSDRFTLRASKTLDERRILSLYGTQVTNQGLGESGFSERTYYEWGAGLSWRFSRSLSGSLSLVQSRQDTEQSGTPRRNRVSFGISYRPQKNLRSW